MHSVWYWLNRYLHAKLELSIFMAFDWAVTLNAHKEHTVLSKYAYNGAKVFIKSYLDLDSSSISRDYKIAEVRALKVWKIYLEINQSQL